MPKRIVKSRTLNLFSRHEPFVDDEAANKHKDNKDEMTQALRPYGLRNQGSTCYLNSVLQILFMTPEIHDRLDPEAPGTDHELKNLFRELKKKTCGTERITMTLGIRNVYQQYDAALCLEEILHKVSPQVSQIFQGQLNDTTKCSEGHSIIKEENPFLILPLSLKDANDRDFDVVSRDYDVKHGFEDIFQSKSFSGDNMVFCIECGMKTEALSECQMGEFPHVLVLLLKRFDRDYSTMTHVKSNRSVEVPGSLQIEDMTYKLYGMVNHMGGLAGGHYTATILSEKDQTWYEFNDSHVRKLQSEEQPFANNRPYNSRTAYLLVYRAQQKLDDSIAAGMQFKAEDRCQVPVGGRGRGYNQTVKEAPPDNGPVMVDIEELGKRQVPQRKLHENCDENGWRVVMTRKKRNSNKHEEREEKGKGRGRGKHISASSSAPSAPARDSSGHVQKQHSWPPQANAEKQGGAKSTRKSASSVELAFGLTEKQRLAKEERNVASVEIQQRDKQSSSTFGSQSGGSSDGGRKKGEKRRSQTNKPKSPVEDVRAPSASAGERLQSSTPPLTTTTPITKPPPADSDSTSAFLRSNKASLPKTNMAASSEVTVKPKAHSYASAAGAPPTSSTFSAVTGGAVPSSVSLSPVITPVLPPAPSSPTSNTVSSPSPPPPSSSPVSTFITPIAPSPSAAWSFLHPSSPPRSSPPVSSFPHSPSPPPVSSNLLTMTGTKTSLSQADPQDPESQTQNPVLFTSVQRQAPTLLPQNQTTYSLIQNQTPVLQKQLPIGPPELQPQPESSNEVTQITPTIPQTSLPQLHYPPHSQPEVVQTQSSVPITQPHPQVQPPPPSQAPHPSLCMFPSQPPAESPPHPSHPDPPPTQPLPPPPLQQQLSQLCKSPLYPGLPQGEKGQVPDMSSSRSRDDLPQEVKSRRSFLHPGVKNPSPSPQYLSHNPQPRPQDSYPPTQYPSTSSSMHPQYDHQAPHTEPPNPSDSTHSQAGYPMTQPPPHRMPPQRNQSSSLGYPFQNPTYSFPQPISKGYQTGHSPGHSLYPRSGPSYHSSFQPSSPYEELLVSQGAMEQHQPSNGNPMHGPFPLQVTSLGRSPIANMANASNSRTGVLPGFGHKTKYGDSDGGVSNHMLLSNRGYYTKTSIKPYSTHGSLTPNKSIFMASNLPDYNKPSDGYPSYQKPPTTTITSVPRGVPEGATTRRYSRKGGSEKEFYNDQFNTSNRGRGRERGGY